MAATNAAEEQNALQLSYMEKRLPKVSIENGPGVQLLHRAITPPLQTFHVNAPT